jgi:hypothetical protein
MKVSKLALLSFMAVFALAAFAQEETPAITPATEPIGSGGTGDAMAPAVNPAVEKEEAKQFNDELKDAESGLTKQKPDVPEPEARRVSPRASAKARAAIDAARTKPEPEEAKPAKPAKKKSAKAAPAKHSKTAAKSAKSAKSSKTAKAKKKPKKTASEE